MARLLAGGVGLEAVWHGRPAADGSALVFLHEGLGSVSLWRDWPERLAARTGRGALVYSRAGYGASDPLPPPWPLDFMAREAETLTEVLSAAGISRPTLVGHSDGATIALLHAAAHPVEALVLLAPHVFVEDVTVASIAAAVADYPRLRPRLDRHHGANTDGAFAGWSGVWLDPGFREWNIEAHVAAVTAPTLVIQGDDDPYGTVRQVDAIASAVRGRFARLLLPGCGHSPHRDRPDESLAAAATFLGASGS